MLAPPPVAPPAVVAACPRKAQNLSCGYVSVPLDRQMPDGRRIRIFFEHWRHTDRSVPAASTVLSIEGGPGFATTSAPGSRVASWRPLAATRDLLLVDLRGTGRSGALTCPAFHRHILGYVRRAAACARQLGPDRDLYDTSQAVQDLAAVLDALHLGKVDLYGDSYGTYAAQAFALRYPDRLRSIVLDSTYPLPGTDPAWADLAEATRNGLQYACARRPACPTDDPVGLVARLFAQVRQHPVTGRAPDGDGTFSTVTVNADTLTQTLQDAYADIGVYRDILAAADSALAGDDAPLLRLVAENRTTDGPNGNPIVWSEALYLSVICHDYPQLWDPGTPIAERPAAARQRIAAYPPGTFAPLDAAAWNGTDYEGVLACLRWPVSITEDPPDPPGAGYPDVPTLVLSGDLDNITAPSGARVVASRFPDSTFVDVHNSVHVTVLGDRDRCASLIYVHFVQTLGAGDTSCAARVAEVRVVPRFPLSLDQVTPARPAAGDGSTLRDRRLASAGAQTAADAIERWIVNYDGTSVGLRGGRWSYSAAAPTYDPSVFTLKRDRFVPGVPVSGHFTWHVLSGGVKGTLIVPGGWFTIAWSMQGPLQRAQLDGRIGGRPLHATMLAP
jgi:pimeloyl-ACP methyl ester carboxylesterase